MILFVPLRVEEASIYRLPWVSISIAAICAVMFFTTYLRPDEPDGMSEEAFERVVEYWTEHPYLEISSRMLGLLNPRFRSLYERRRADALRSAPPEEELEVEQEELDERIANLFQGAEQSLLRRLALVPERGFFQLGLLTHMFLHIGWMHLLGNLFFFYLTGLMLEDRWGRGFFTAFYLLGGLFAGAAHFVLDRTSPTLMVGASGAIAACMGAFAVRFAAERVRFWYFIWILRIWLGTVLVPAWVCGLLWFGGEVWSLFRDDGASGVAFAAHVAGFAFGAVTAIGLKVSGFEARYIAPMIEEATSVYARTNELDRAEEALARGDAAAARKELQDLLAKTPDLPDAELMLVKMDAASNPVAALGRAERVLVRLAGKDPDAMVLAVEELSAVLDLSKLRAAAAFRVAQGMDRAPEGLRPLAERLFAAAAREPSFAARALVQAAQARLDSGGEARDALEYLDKLRTAPGFTAELRARADELRKRAQEIVDREKEISPRFSRAIALDDEPPTPPEASEPAGVPEDDPFVEEAPRSGPVRVMECALGGMTRDNLSLTLEGGKQTNLSIESLVAVAVGVAPEPAPPPSPPRNILYTDLVTSWGGGAKPAQVFRLKSSTLRLQNLYPGMKAQEAYALFLQHLLDQSGATALPDAAALRSGQYPRYPDVEALNRAMYG